MTSLTAAPRIVADTVPRSWVTDALLVTGAAAFIGISAQLYVYLPGNPVPITGQTFAVLLSAAALGLSRGVLATLLYALLGMVGMPWFADGAHGVVAASFGYIVGFVLAAAMVGALAQRGGTSTPLRTFGTMLVGSLAIYAVGLPWLKVVAGLDWVSAFALGVAPFVLGDVIKAGLAAGIFAAAWALIRRRSSERDAA